MRKLHFTWCWVFSMCIVTLVAQRTFAGATLRFVVQDGQAYTSGGQGPQGFASGFGRHISGIYDTDGFCDGLCTFVLPYQSAHCVRCGFGLCRPVEDDNNPQCDLSGVGLGSICGPAPYRNRTYVVPAGRGRAGRRRVRIFGFNVELRCLPNPQCPVTAVLHRPASAALSGLWQMTEQSVAATDCSPDVLAAATERYALTSPIRVGIEQTDAALAGCLQSYATAFVAGVSSRGFRSSQTELDELCFPNGGCAFAHVEASGGALLPDGSIDMTLRYTFAPVPFPPHPGPDACAISTTARLSRVPGPACQSHADCSAVDPCSRCIEGTCGTDGSCPEPPAVLPVAFGIVPAP